jgi:hypothetical protein
MGTDWASMRPYCMARGGGHRRWLWGVCITAHAGCLANPGDPSVASNTAALSELTGESERVTWTCTDSPCPWGDSLANPAIAWPAEAGPVATRLGYSASPAAYLPADQANGLIVAIESGTASLYAGQPFDDSHRWIATLSPGDRYQVAGLSPGEVLSVQSDDAFRYHVTPGEPPASDPPSDPSTASQTATWTCTADPCPWGDSLTAEALVWPDDAGALATRLGYTASPAIYLPAARANGAHLAIDTGSADAYAGRPDDASQRRLATISAGQTFDVAGLVDGEVLSVQADAPFTYRVQLGDPGDPPPGGDVIQAIQAFWVCNIPECSGDPWTGAVITWPAWAAYQSNARSYDQSRSVFTADGEPLYPYMGAWADGCEVTAVSGPVLIIEWQRGTDDWRETPLASGQSHTIHLVAPEDGAMIETYDGVPGFSVSLRSCTPQPLPE